MRRVTILALLLTLMIICGVVISFLVTGGHDDPPHISPVPAAPEEERPVNFTPAQNQEIEVVFITVLRRVPIPLDIATVIDRGDLLASPTGGGGWKTTVLRTTTHLTITHESDIGGTYRKQEHTIALADLPMEFPHEKIRTMATGRFEVTTNERKPDPAP